MVKCHEIKSYLTEDGKLIADSIPPPSCKNCIDVHCSNELDFSNSHENPYICLSEEEAQNWHKKCLPLDSDPGYGEDYCQYNGK